MVAWVASTQVAAVVEVTLILKYTYALSRKLCNLLATVSMLCNLPTPKHGERIYRHPQLSRSRLLSFRGALRLLFRTVVQIIYPRYYP